MKYKFSENCMIINKPFLNVNIQLLVVIYKAVTFILIKSIFLVLLEITTNSHYQIKKSS